MGTITLVPDQTEMVICELPVRGKSEAGFADKKLARLEII